MTKRKIAFLSISVALFALLVGGALFGQATEKNSVYRYLSIFSEVFDLVRSNYVEQVPSEQLMDGAFAGVTDAIDEFSYYVPPAQMTAYKRYSEVEDNGVGIVLSKRFGYAYVISVVPGSPADRAGVERGDFIEKVNGATTPKLPIWQVRSALRASGPVKLALLRGGQTKRDEVTLQPASFHPVNVSEKSFGTVAYVQIPYFEKGAAAKFRADLDDVRKRGVKKLIVDLRGNAGGDVEEAITAADELLAGGTITSLQGRRVDAKTWNADKATSYDGELLVLVDPSTASGAEVFAGAIRGNSRGKVVGVTTYGKAIVQKFVTLPSGGGVQMTIGHYTTPDLKPIKETGVKPDVVVDLAAESIPEEGAPRSTKKASDAILRKALTLFGEEDEAAALKKAA